MYVETLERRGWQASFGDAWTMGQRRREIPDWAIAATRRKAMNRKAGHKMAWKIVGNHVYPVDDLREHTSTDCWCRPTDDDGVVVHNSLDGRELYEEGERKLS
jgi:hypothetical protein